MARIHYQGGDCDGRIVEVPDTFNSDSIRCGDTIYNLTLVAQGEWFASVKGAYKPPGVEPVIGELPAGEESDYTDARFLDAWGGLLHALGNNLQGGLRRSYEARQRMRAKR